MPGLREDDVIAILCSDIHLSMRAPPARALEPNWFAAMDRALGQLFRLQAEWNVPVIIAGDIFDHWQSPPELINYAIGALPPKVYAIPGQHDLPNHNYAEIERSAYGTLMYAGKITNLRPGKRHRIGNLVVYAFPWGYKPEPVKEHNDEIQLAIVHDYIWAPGLGYSGAPDENRVMAYLNRLAGYDAAVFGDNHKGFICGQVFNCGTFMRRHTDDALHKPMVGLLQGNGVIVRHYLNTKEDKFDAAAAEVFETADPEDMRQFLKELTQIQEGGLDYAQAIRRWIAEHKPRRRVVELLLESLGDVFN